MAQEKNSTLEWIKALGFALLIVFVVRTFLFTPVMVKGASMNTTLEDQERVIVSKLGETERFDIVVFQATPEEKYIKRVIGLPGDRIQYKEDTLYVNGKTVEEPFLDDQKEKLETSLTTSFKLEETAVGQSTVPEGHIFVLGDNRRDSKDSRQIGAIPIETIIGKTNVVFFPLSNIRLIEE
ncbi:signal peptidase I [Rossellomorea vietnamensis]|uniref:Signal peptidase I n=2 Tax=Rossellomorea TaxID=2837508 RepID=A0A5D4KA20_9BACI|nr:MULTISPECIES: signal peptidase I [Rossellomorea]TYR74207.1 signal peptidase I [Rossellomorea vietnamensis]TYS79729.1 signal peptidase I [Rossellomorea aquimaris]